MAKRKEPIKKSESTNVQGELEQVIDYREVGATGLKRFSGFIFEEFLQELTGWRGVATYKEMSQNDPIIGAMLFAIRVLIRKVAWFTEPASQMQFDVDAEEFLESCMNDMSQTWIDMIDEVLSMLIYGFSVHEICYKRRCGDVFDPTMRSKHSDGRIGWRKFPIRSQDSIYRWQFDDHGGIQGVEQLAPPHYYHVTIPVEKILLFRTTIEKNNPEGRSILRNAYRPWYMKKNIENIEAIGVERDLAGLPCIYVPAEIMTPGADANQKSLLGAMKTLVQNIRRDQLEGVVMPTQYDASGKPLFELKLLSTGGNRQFDTNEIIQRYDQRIAMCALADFILVGHESVGSFAMTSSKTDLFASAVGAILDMVTETFNRYAIPRLMALNDFQMSDYPRIKHGDLAATDLKVLGDYIQKLAQSGMQLFPNHELEKDLMKRGNLPEPVDPLTQAQADMMVDAKDPEKPDRIVEIPENRLQIPTGLDKPADTTPVNQKPPVQTVTTNQTGNTETNSFNNNRKDTIDALRQQKKINYDF